MESIMVYKFAAPWCGPCQQMKRSFEQLEKDFCDKAQFVSINVDEEENIAKEFNIMAVPTVIIVRNDNVVLRHTGASLAPVENYLSEL